MTIQYPDSTTVEINTGSWVDIGQYVMGNIHFTFGFSTNTPDVRIANAAILDIVLNNIGRQFSPNAAEVLSGWKKGIPIRVVVTFQSIPYVVWYGRITDIDPDAEPYGERRCNVVASNWMDIAAKTPLPPMAIATNQRADEGVQDVLDVMGIAPQNTDLSEGIDTFPTVHDTLNENAYAYTEFNRLALSEFGMMYLRRDRLTGETLVLENRQGRDARTDIREVPTENPGFFELATGDLFLLATGDYLKLNTTEEVSFQNNAKDMTVKNGKNLYNDVTFRYYPRRVDVSAQTLAVTYSRVFVSAGETETIRLSYVDPTGGGALVNLSSVDALTSNMFENSDGTGSDLSANLTVTADYGTNYAEFELENTGGTDGWVYLSLDGYGVYFYDAVTINKKDVDSIEDYGISEFVIDQKYQQYSAVSGPLAQVILDRYPEPVSAPQTVRYIANKSFAYMMYFLFCDTGDLVPIRNTQTAIDANFFIHGGEVTISPGGIIDVNYLITDALSLSDSYWLVETVGASEVSETTIVGV